MEKTIKNLAEDMLQRCNVVVLTSITSDGYPRPVPMSKIKAEGISEIWMSTGLSSFKTKDFMANPKSGLCFMEEGNSVVLTGEVEIVTDSDMKKELWHDWFIEHFPKGVTDPEYVLIKFTTKRATYWINGEFVR